MYEYTWLTHNKGCVIYQLLIEAHLSQVLLEDLAVHVHALLPNIVVPVDLRIHTLSPCTQTLTTLSHSSTGKSQEGLINSMHTAYCNCAQDHRQPDRTMFLHQHFCVCTPASRNAHLGLLRPAGLYCALFSNTSMLSRLLASFNLRNCLGTTKKSRNLHCCVLNCQHDAKKHSVGTVC